MSLSLKENVTPIFFSLPLAWKDKIETKLRDMIEMDILEIVDNFDWGTPLVPVLKPNGTLKVKRLPFGVKTAASIFQKTIENLFRGIPHVVVYQDDITITGRNLQEHLQTLDSVLSKLSSAGLTLNEVTYLGFRIDKYGLRKTPERISCIENAPTPTNVTELKAFVCMVNYYSKFVSNFANKMIPLYNLLSKNVKFTWSKECQRAYEQIKKDIISDQVLIHLPIILTTDANNNAVAGVLSHRLSGGSLRPIAFISRALTKSELNYAPIEKEGLAIIFSVSKLRQYLLGNKFTIRTDHKPLLTLFGQTKGIPVMAAARI